MTTAAPPRSDDISIRQRNYLITMALRLVCLFGAVLTTGWLMWVCMVGVVVLPSVAVVLANAVTRPKVSGLQIPTASTQRMLPPGKDT